MLTALGAGHDAQAAKKKKRHHKGHAPASGKASEPDTGEETSSGGEGETGAAAAEPAPSKPAPEPEAAPAAEEESGGGKPKKKIKMEGEASASPEPGAPSGLPWLDVSLGVSLLSRDLSFHQDADPQGSQLSPYSLPAWPVGLVSAVLYLDPLVSALGNLGVEGHVMQGFGVNSRFSGSSTSFASTVHDYSAGARYRFPFGAGNAMFVSARGGEDAFTFNGPNRSSLLTPDTIYHYVRGGVGLQMALSPSMSVSAGGGYRYITNKGGPQISGPFFPHLTVAGADAQVALTYALSDIYALRAGADWRRYWYDFHTVRGDNFLVGGAVDQSFLFSVSLVLTIGGSSGEHAEAEEAPATKPGAKPAKGDKPKTDKGDEGGDAGGGGSDEGSSSSKPSGGDDL